MKKKKETPGLSYSYERLEGENRFLLNLYRLGNRGKDMVVVISPDGIRGLDAIAARLREELRARRVADAAAAHDQAVIQKMGGRE